MEVVFRGNTTKAEVRERKRKEKQDELGVCRIRRTRRGDRCSQTLGSGFVVKDLQIFRGLRFPYCLISSDKVFPENDSHIESYYLDFRKLDSTDLETVKLEDVAKSSDISRTSGLVLIPINPSKKCNKNKSIFTYRPFKVANVGTATSDDLKCYFVDDRLGETNFSVTGLELKRSETVSTQCQLHEVNERPYTKYGDIIDRGDHRKPYGAVILKRSNNEFMAVGALTFADNECRNICSAFFPLPLQPQTSESVPDDNEYHVPEQQPPADNATSTDGSEVTSSAKADETDDGDDSASDDEALNLRIDVETMRPAEHNTQAFRTPASTVESEGAQNGGNQEASTVLVPSEQTQPSCTNAEAPQAPTSPIPSEGEVLRLIAINYLQAKPLRCTRDPNDFLEYMEKMQLIFTGASVGSLLITVKCDSLQILERLWEDYSSGHLGEVVQRCFVTQDILTGLSLAELKLKTTILEEEYKACKMYLGKDQGRGLCGNVTVPVEQPIHVHFTDEENVSQRDEEDDLQTETVKEKLKKGTDEGSSVSVEDEDQFGNEAVPVPLENTAGFPGGTVLKGRDDISFDSGISSFAPSSRSELHRWKYQAHQIVEMELKMFDVSSPKELQDYLTNLTNKMDSSVQESRPSVKHFTEAMDDYTLREFVSIHVKEGAWQVVLLFLDELIRRDGGRLYWWPTHEDRDLEVLCKVLTEGDCKLDSLDLHGIHSITDKGAKHIAEVVSSTHCHLNFFYLRGERLTDEGVKHIAEALSNTHCHLNCLDLSGNKVTDEGVKHIAEALSSSQCLLNRLYLGQNEVTDEGVKHIAKALSSSQCPLNRLYLGHNDVTDEGVKHIAEALSSSQCPLNNLDLSKNKVTDEGVKHIAEALSSSQCLLNRLYLGHNEVTDEGVKHIAEALSSSQCPLNSLDLSWNEVTDEGVKHIAEALSSSQCPLTSLDLRGNKVTDEGVKHLAQALEHSKYKLDSFRSSSTDIVIRAK